eukprot:scaffold122050_cov52-Attheya_sp.AAC.4
MRMMVDPCQCPHDAVTRVMIWPARKNVPEAVTIHLHINDDHEKQTTHESEMHPLQHLPPAVIAIRLKHPKCNEPKPNSNERHEMKPSDNNNKE